MEPVPPADPDLPDPALPDRLTFRAGPAMVLRLSIMLLLVGVMGVAAATTDADDGGPQLLWLGLIAGLAGLALPLLLLPAATRLELRRDGWVQVALFRAWPTDWSTVDGFTAERRPGGWVIGVRRRDGGTGAITANWRGIAPVELAALMSRFRARRLAELGSAAPAVPSAAQAPAPLPDRLVLRGGWTRGLVGWAVALGIVGVAVGLSNAADASDERALTLIGTAAPTALILAVILWPLTRRLDLRPDRFVVQNSVRLRALDWRHARGFAAVARRRGWVIAYERLPGAGEPPGPAELPGDWHGIDAPALAALMTRFRARRLAALGEDDAPLSP